jgi:hypothetical protein
MRGALDAVLAPVRAHRRLAEYRRLAAAATSSYVAERDQAEGGPRANASPKTDGLSWIASGFSVRRSLIAGGAAVMLAIVALTAASSGVSGFNEGTRSRVPPAVTHLTRAAAVSGSAAPGAPVGGSGGSSAAPPGDRGAPAPPAQDTSAAAIAGAPVGTIPSATDSAPAAGSAPPTSAAPTSASSHLLDLCRSVVAAGNGWPSVLKGADRATVIAAAGKKNNVLAYCTNLVATG